MKGMSHTNGRSLEGVPHLSQSIARILTTPLGSRIARRSFGSELYSLVDAPDNAATRVRVFAAVATALMKWEPRVRLTRIGITSDATEPGTRFIEIEGTTSISRDLVVTRVPMPTTGKPL